MEKYKFVYNDRIYELGEENFEYLVNDEEHPVSGIDENTILSLLNSAEDVGFDVEYYDEPCENCLFGREEKVKYFKFLEYHFYIYTKNGQYVISTISKDYEDTSYNKLLKQGKVDNSYIVSIIVCINCGHYSIEIEQCEV